MFIIIIGPRQVHAWLKALSHCHGFELRLQTIKKYRANSGFIVVTVVCFFFLPRSKSANGFQNVNNNRCHSTVFKNTYNIELHSTGLNETVYIKRLYQNSIYSSRGMKKYVKKNSEFNNHLFQYHTVNLQVRTRILRILECSDVLWGPDKQSFNFLQL